MVLCCAGCAGRKRKKVEEPMSDDEDHGDFDPQQLREHEEFTKVKNIDVIQLGMHEMDTWYFSPFPPEYKDCKVTTTQHSTAQQVGFKGHSGPHWSALLMHA
jgi:hypothetical protein